MIHVETTRFGTVAIDPAELLNFPQGLIGMGECHRWVLLLDAENESVGWLQSVDQPELAVAVVSPRRFAPDYQVRLPRAEMATLELLEAEQVLVLALLARHGDRLTLNLKAPLVINLDRRWGRQVTVIDDQPLRLEIALLPTLSRKAA